MPNSTATPKVTYEIVQKIDGQEVGRISVPENKVVLQMHSAIYQYFLGTGAMLHTEFKDSLVALSQ